LQAALYILPVKPAKGKIKQKKGGPLPVKKKPASTTSGAIAMPKGHVMLAAA
jgi:hypothetical protein